MKRHEKMLFMEQCQWFIE